MPEPRRGRPPTLSADRIAEAAKDRLAAGGLAALSMRALAKDLGTSPMALYRHVDDKEHLLDLVLDRYSTGLAELVLPEDPVARIRTIFVAIFDTITAETWLVELLQHGGRGGSGAIVLVERAIVAGQDLGMDLRRSLLFYRALWNYTLGALLNIPAPNPTGEVSPLTAKIREAGAQRLPALNAITANWPMGTTRDTYLDGLDALIAGYCRAFGANADEVSR
ncbi:TetR/AcrR family transcriptional regulator [Rhodococcus gannanensis]|uniref:TetR/AcrR family transcriptional regulator n=1 Tax=Rhodococcus gannanensis TaxID=1960308 RepID=A0ABW4P2Y3_9NOCA